MERHLQTITPLLLSALALIPSSAQAQATQAGELASMCLLNSDGARQAKLELDSLFVQVLTVALPDRFSVVQDQEDCEDPRDNNCDGEINEGCSEDYRWQAGADCDACMQDKCERESDPCEDQDCEDVINCIIEDKCLDEFLGPLGCVCGKNVSIRECQMAKEGELEGTCADEMLRSMPQNPFRTGPDFAPFFPRTPAPMRPFICMGRFCQSECTELIYND